MAQTVWSILPPVITIVLALWTKEVYMSLIIGIFSGALLFTGGNILESIPTMFAVMEDKVGGNVNILVFLVILGILVAAITRSGATRAYGAWAAKAIHGKRSASLLTALLGIVIFIDDYFNCLTVGTVMRPVTDKFKIARTKAGLHHRAGVELGGGRRLVAAGRFHDRRLHAVLADNPVQPLRLVHARLHDLHHLDGARLCDDGPLRAGERRALLHPARVSGRR